MVMSKKIVRGVETDDRPKLGTIHYDMKVLDRGRRHEIWQYVGKGKTYFELLNMRKDKTILTGNKSTIFKEFESKETFYLADADIDMGGNEEHYRITQEDRLRKSGLVPIIGVQMDMGELRESVFWFKKKIAASIIKGTYNWGDSETMRELFKNARYRD